MPSIKQTHCIPTCVPLVCSGFQMSSSGYDLSCTTYSPDGKIFQTEYATKAVENGSTCIGIKVSGGIVLATEKVIHSKLLIRDANRRIASIDRQCGLVCTGLLPDGINIVNRAKSEATDYHKFYRQRIPGKILSARMSMYVQAYTLYGSVRPFGVATLMAIADTSGPQLYMIEPSGDCLGYNACAAGKGTRNAKNELEKLDLATISIQDAVKEAARIMYEVHNAQKDKEMKLELSWICQESNWEHRFVPDELLAAAEAYAKTALDEKMQE